MLPKFDLETTVLAPGQAVAVLASHEIGLPRACIWPHWQQLIAHIVGVTRAELTVARSANGKPRLEASAGVWFNVSYGRRHSLLALSRTAEIGCDVEDRLMAEDGEKLAPLVLHRNEAGSLDALAPHERAEAFARCWVRKEAVLKAIGTGFGEDPRKFDVRPTEKPPRVDIAGWRLHDLPGASVAAAVACRDEACAWFALQVSS